MPKMISLTDAAIKLGIKPLTLSNLLWRRELDADRCPLLGRRRYIPTDYLPTIRKYLNNQKKRRLKAING